MISRLKATAVVAVVAGALLTALTAQAGILYDNGPADGMVDAWTINFDYAVADSFTLADPSTLTGATFTLWNLPGDVTSQVAWSIVGSPTAGPILASGVASVSQIFQFTGNYGYDINLDTIAFSDIVLGAGIYWFELQDAIVSNEDPTYWDMNGGPSQVWESSFGYNPDPNIYASGLNSTSDPFQILGTTSIPEPASLFLLGSGVCLVSLRRRKEPQTLVPRAPHPL